MTERYSTGHLIKMLGITTTTLYDWEEKEIIPKGHRDKVNGRRYWTKEQVEEIKIKTGRG